MEKYICPSKINK